MLMILTWFSVIMTSQLVMAVAACNVNFVNVYMIHVYTRASLIRSPNPNHDSSNRISPNPNANPNLLKLTLFERLAKKFHHIRAKFPLSSLSNVRLFAVATNWSD